MIFSQSPLLLISRLTGIAFIIMVLGTSCATIVKNYPKGKPFVYETNINVNGNFSNEERETLESGLRGQLDDSMRSRSVSKLLWNVMKNPPVYDSSNAAKSIVFMRALLTSLGYFKDSIYFKSSVDTAKTDQLRTTVDFYVTPGKVVKIDSFSYNIKQADLQSIAIANQQDAFVKKGEPFAKAAISVELDRLVNLYRNNGYLRFSREELIGLWDTLDVSLLQPTLDPFEQLELLEKLRQRRENPTANLEIRLKPGFDSTRLTKYYIGNVTVYPDITLDTSAYSRKETVVNGIKVVSYLDMFKPKIFPQNIYLKQGQLYDQRNYFKTINRFNSLGSWRLVNIEQVPRGTLDTADFNIRMTPARKYSFTANLEGSRNNTAVSGNLFGIAINVGLQNRNFARAANQASTTLRFGVETGRNKLTDIKFIQTRQLSLNHTIYFPRPIIPFLKKIPENVRNSFRTILAFNASITERRELYNLNNVNASWGYEFQAGKKFFTLRIPNIEYSYFKALPTLQQIFNNNPSLRFIFTDGLISSLQGGMTATGGKNKNVNVFRTNIEASGLITGLIKNNAFLDTNLYRFIKVDAEFTRKIVLAKNAIALRIFAGVGYEFNSTANPNKRNNLPFFRQYFAGGPNSMRAWALRRLGPGSVVKDFDGITGFSDRYGDVQLEANIEYRFPLGKLFGIKINGAVFTDMGNIWYLKKGPASIGRLPEEVFNFSRLGTDLAIGSGVGIRVDFDFFVVRFDASHKVKDPSPSTDRAYLQNKWFGYVKNDFLRGTQFQLGISYPFIL